MLRGGVLAADLLHHSGVVGSPIYALRKRVGNRAKGSRRRDDNYLIDFSVIARSRPYRAAAGSPGPLCAGGVEIASSRERSSQ
jgi:hypothetical protein